MRGRWKYPTSEMQQNIRTFYLVCTCCLSLSFSLFLSHSVSLILTHRFYIGLLMAAVWVCIHDTTDKFLHSLQESINVHLFALSSISRSHSLSCLHLTPETNIAATLKEGLSCTKTFAGIGNEYLSRVSELDIEINICLVIQ